MAEQLRAVGIKPSSIILEPVGRNTAPAIAAAAISALRPDEDNILLVLSSDHHMDHSDSFSAAVSAGSGLAEHDYLVTFGIVPAYPETGYGYIEKGEPVAMAGQGGFPDGTPSLAANLLAFSSGQPVGGDWSQPAGPTPEGPAQLSFTSPTQAVFTYNNATYHLTRFSF